MKARDYQQECCDRLIDAMAVGHRWILCTLFTGAGKTVIFSLLAKMLCNSKILIIAPMRELVWQAADTADRVTGEYTDVEMAGAWGQDGRVTVASAQTLLRGRYKRFLGVRVVIIDECHTQFSPAFLAMLREFVEAGGYVIGFTATPFRMDGKPLMEVYEHEAFHMAAEEGIDQGWCVPPLAKIVRCRHFKMTDVRVTGGDFSAADLDLIMGAARPLSELCVTIQRERRGAAIAFLPGVASARALAEMAPKYGINAAFVCGDKAIQPEDERNRIIARYRQGDLDLLCNCQVATMGFDAPITETIFMARPTKSLVLALQIYGRAMRPLPGVVDGLETAEERRAAIAASDKPHFRIIDITDSVADHRLVTAVDMFVKEPELREFAREAAGEADEPMDEADLLAQAAEKLRKAKLIEEGLRALHGQAEAELHAEEVNIRGQKKDIADYKVPLRGRYAGKRMRDVPDGYIDWALRQPTIRGWQRGYFRREKERRTALQHA
jgi:superfamily II DNA or RNA helicase